VLCFGLIRPYKGIDVLLEAWRGIEDAELWVVGLPKMDLAPLRAAAPPGVRFVPRFVADDEIPAFFRRADLVVLPYREIEQSGLFQFPQLLRTGNELQAFAVWNPLPSERFKNGGIFILQPVFKRNVVMAD
jgi:glycosyltransferase involved in cell wall biosynthesis